MQQEFGGVGRIENAEDYERMIFENQTIDIDDAWAVIRSYFKKHGLVSQQISSFNRFLEVSIQEIVNEH